jgi:hypothetical protein
MKNNELYRIAKAVGYAASIILLLVSLFCLCASVGAMIGKAEPFAAILFLPGLVLGLICFFLFKFTQWVQSSHSLWIQLLLLAGSSIITLLAFTWIFG